MTDKTKFISEHVLYTVDQMQGTRLALRNDHDPILRNALIESFCISARALIDFTLGKNGENATDYADGYIPWANGRVSKDLTRRLSHQIAHLTLKRTEAESEKLDGRAREDLYVAVITEMEVFRKCLKAEYKPYLAEPFELLGPQAQGPFTSTATNVIRSVTGGKGA